MATYKDCFSIKTNVIGNIVEVFLVCIKKDFYQQIKSNGLNIDIKQYIIKFYDLPKS